MSSIMKLKSVIVTGSNRGLGLEFVRQILKFPEPPKWLFATCRNPDQAKELQEVAASHSNVKVVKLEVANSESIKSLVSQVEKEVGDDGLNLLINNAGALERVNLEGVTEEAMVESFKINSLAPLMIAKAFVPLLKKAAGKSTIEGLSSEKAAIINITSKMGSISDNTSGSSYAYRASKAALNMITKSLSVDLKPEGIIAVVVHPGWVRTNMGGPRGLIEADESVAGMLKVISSLNEEKIGGFFNYNGAVIEW